MNTKNTAVAMPMSGALATLVVLSLLYFAFILRDWHYIEDIRQMAIPFVVFGLFSGSLLSVMPLPRLVAPSLQPLAVAAMAALIPTAAILIHISLIAPVGFKPVNLPPHSSIAQTFYQTFAVASVLLFACTAVSGFYAAVATSQSIMSRLDLASLEKKTRNELVAASLTTLIGLIGAVLTAILAGHGA